MPPRPPVRPSSRQEAVQLYVGAGGASLLALLTLALALGALPQADAVALLILGGVMLAVGFGGLRKPLWMFASLASALAPAVVMVAEPSDHHARWSVTLAATGLLAAFAGFVMRGIAAEQDNARARTAAWCLFGATLPLVLHALPGIGFGYAGALSGLVVLGEFAGTAGLVLAALVMGGIAKGREVRAVQDVRRGTGALSHQPPGPGSEGPPKSSTGPSDASPTPLMIEGFGVALALRVPVGVAHLEGGTLVIGPINLKVAAAQARQGGPRNALLVPGKPPTAPIEERRDPSGQVLSYETREPGETALRFGRGVRFEDLVVSYEAAPHAAHAFWRIVTTRHAVSWPERLTLRVTAEQGPPAAAYELAHEGSSEDFISVFGPLTRAEVPRPEQIRQPGWELVGDGGVEGTSVLWVEFGYQHANEPWRQRWYYLPASGEDVFMLRAQARASLSAKLQAAADAVAATFRPTDADATDEHHEGAGPSASPPGSEDDTGPEDGADAAVARAFSLPDHLAGVGPTPALLEILRHAETTLEDSFFLAHMTPLGELALKIPGDPRTVILDESGSEDAARAFEHAKSLWAPDRPAASEAALEAIVLRYPLHVDSWAALYRHAKAKSDFAKAEFYVRQWIAIAPTYGSLAALATLLGMTGRLSQARVVYDYLWATRSSASKDEALESTYNFLVTLGRLCDGAAMVLVATAAVQEFGEDPTLCYQWALGLLLRGQHDTAAEIATYGCGLVQQTDPLWPKFDELRAVALAERSTNRSVDGAAPAASKVGQAAHTDAPENPSFAVPIHHRVWVLCSSESITPNRALVIALDVAYFSGLPIEFLYRPAVPRTHPLAVRVVARKRLDSDDVALYGCHFRPRMTPDEDMAFVTSDVAIVISLEAEADPGYRGLHLVYRIAAAVAKSVGGLVCEPKAGRGERPAETTARLAVWQDGIPSVFDECEPDSSPVRGDQREGVHMRGLHRFGLPEVFLPAPRDAHRDHSMWLAALVAQTLIERRHVEADGFLTLDIAAIRHERVRLSLTEEASRQGGSTGPTVRVRLVPVPPETEPPAGVGRIDVNVGEGVFQPLSMVDDAPLVRIVPAEGDTPEAIEALVDRLFGRGA